jgi:hypothetical protein
MAIPEAYVVVPSSLTKFLETARTAGVPQRVTFEFLKTLGLKSSNDRSIIGVLKAIGFLDQNGTPTDTYKRFRDPATGPRVLAEALKAAYSDLFMANTKANELPAEKLRGIIATKTDKGERVVKEIAATFKALAKAADFSEPREEEKPSMTRADSKRPGALEALDQEEHLPEKPQGPQHRPQFHYNIQIHLPTTTDITVYNAIFKALRENLL